MNLISYELKASYKSAIVWLLTLLGLFFVMMLGAYPVYYEAKEDVAAVLANFPKEFMSAFGMDLEILFSFGGFYNFSFGYIAVVGAIMAVSLAVSVFGREKRSKCSDFLLTKPLKRETIFMEKFVSCLIILVSTNLIYVLGAVFVYRAGGEPMESFGNLFLAAWGLLFTQLIFMGFGIMYTVLIKNIRSIAGIATAFGFGAFILSAITNLIEEEVLVVIAPLKYFEPKIVFTEGSYDIKLIIVAAIVFAASLTISFIKFCKSDAHAV